MTTVVETADAATRLADLLALFKRYADQVEPLMLIHPDLLPEIKAANDHVAAAAEALSQAADVLKAKLEIAGAR